MSIRSHRARTLSAVLGLGLVVLSSPPAAIARPDRGAAPAPRAVGQVFAPARAAQPGLTVIRFDPGMVQDLAAARGPVLIERFPVRPDLTVDLQVTPFRVTTPNTRFVVGRRHGPDEPLPFDPASVLLFRGSVRGSGDSHVFLSISPWGSAGRVDLGPAGPSYFISSRGGGRVDLGEDELVVFPGGSGPGPTGGGLPVSCGVDTSAPGARSRQRPVQARATPIHGLKQIEVAVETDYEYYLLFNDLNAAAAYVTQVYALISDIYVRDVNTWVDLTYVRLWDHPSGLYPSEDPLGQFREHWNNNMQSVPRDVAQYFAGRRNLSAGGVAYLNGLCNNNSYSWAGYILGYFADPDTPSVFNRDFMVTAHELGHNCATPHTHDLGLDECDDENTTVTRGTIMSYCGQTFTGGEANMDARFHAVCQQIMEDYIFARGCVADDCNGNGVPDAGDITSGFSTDTNANGVPDECEDCNGNGILDPQEIALGLVTDLNGNGIPDPCDPDCNQNGRPDDLDFVASWGSVAFHDSFETDLGWAVENLGATAGNWERGVPVNDPGWQYDPESDADGSGRCLLTQNAPGNTDVDNGATRVTSPNLDLSAGGLSIGYSYYLNLTNENGADRILVEASATGLAGPWATVATHATNGGLDWRTHVVTPGALAAAGLSPSSTFRVRFTINDSNPQSVVEGGVDAFFVGVPTAPVSVDWNANNIPDECEPDANSNGVLDYKEIAQNMGLDLNRNIVPDAVEDCDNDGATDLVELDQSHNIWLTSKEQPILREYLHELGTQTRLSADAGIAEGRDLIITADRRILVTSGLDSRVMEFAADGQFVRNLVAPGAGGLADPGAMIYTQPGTLLVASGGNHAVLRYDGATGGFQGFLVASGAGGLTGPYGMAFGPNGHLFVTSANHSVLEFDGVTGGFVRVFVAPGAGGLNTPRGLLFLPGSGNLLVASKESNAVLEFNGTTGAFVRKFNQNGTATVMTLDQPTCLRLGPEGSVYVSRTHDQESAPLPGTGALHLTNARIYEFRSDNGYFVRAYIMGVNSGVLRPTGFDFVPDQGTDCNHNLYPDNCDIASGRSQDLNHNGIPDECEASVCYADCDGSGSLNVNDYICFQTKFAIGDPYADCDGNGMRNVNDYICFQTEFALGCP